MIWPQVKGDFEKKVNEYFAELKDFIVINGKSPETSEYLADFLWSMFFDPDPPNINVHCQMNNNNLDQTKNFGSLGFWFNSTTVWMFANFSGKMEMMVPFSVVEIEYIEKGLKIVF